jgi:hypothetical protein
MLAAVVLSAIALGAAGAQQGAGDKKAAAPVAQQAGKAKSDTAKKDAKADSKKSSKKGMKKGGAMAKKDSTKAPATKKP